MRKGSNFAALATYLVISATFFASSLWNNFSTRIVGVSADPTLSIWCFSWWPYAIRHHLNPFFSYKVMVPTGANLSWAGSIPLPALIGAPITGALRRRGVV